MGDSGYKLLAWLLMPFLDCVNQAQEKYNKAQIRTRLPVEQSFGILKKRFFCLQKGIAMVPDSAAEIIQVLQYTVQC